MLEAVIIYTLIITDVQPASVTQGYFYNTKYPWTLEYCENYVLPEFTVNINSVDNIELRHAKCEMVEVNRQGEKK